jgi:hypothetical protein
MPSSTPDPREALRAAALREGFDVVRFAKAEPPQSAGADLRQFLEGVQGRLPFRHGELRQVGVVADDDRAFRLARLPRLVHRGDLLLVVRCARPVAVAGRVDDGDVKTTAGHEEVRTADHCRMLLVVAPTVAHQDQGRAIGAGGRRPENSGDLAHGEVALDHAV